MPTVSQLIYLNCDTSVRWELNPFGINIEQQQKQLNKTELTALMFSISIVIQMAANVIVVVLAMFAFGERIVTAT